MEDLDVAQAHGPEPRGSCAEGSAGGHQLARELPRRGRNPSIDGDRRPLRKAAA